MEQIRQAFATLPCSRTGNIGVSAALVLPLVVLSLGLGVDYGHLTLQKREIQSLADIAAIVAASDIQHAEDAARRHFKANDVNVLTATGEGLMTVDGDIVTPDATNGKNGIATIVKGRYVPDPAIAAGQRFIPQATPADAVQVSIEREGALYVAAMLGTPPKLGAVGTAATTKLAAFSIGTRLASLQDGILNALLGSMLGAGISLKLMDYRALADADIDTNLFLRDLSTRLDLTAATYGDVLTAEVLLPQMISSLRATRGLSNTATVALKTLETAAARNRETFSMSQILNVDPQRGLGVDAGSAWDMQISALDMVAAAAMLANGRNQIALRGLVAVPGLASVDIDMAIGEPPVETPPRKLGAPGSAVRTAQTRLAVEITIDGLAALAGLKIKVPLFIEIAHAEAKLADIRCYGGVSTNASVAIDAVPGLAEIAIGTVAPSVLSNFSKGVRVEKARLVDARVLRIDGMSQVETKNMKPQRLTFSPSEVAGNSMKSISTKDTLTSTTQTLLQNLDVDVEVLFLSLGTPKHLQSALAETLGAVTPQIDALLYNLLLVAGVRVGEADIRITGVNCQQPVLVQ